MTQEDVLRIAQSVCVQYGLDAQCSVVKSAEQDVCTVTVQGGAYSMPVQLRVYAGPASSAAAVRESIKRQLDIGQR